MKHAFIKVWAGFLIQKTTGQDWTFFQCIGRTEELVKNKVFESLEKDFWFEPGMIIKFEEVWVLETDEVLEALNEL